MIKEIVSENLRYYRLKCGFSQEKLAEYCNLHPTTISDFERMRVNPSLESIEKLAKAFDIEIYKLFMSKENKRN